MLSSVILRTFLPGSLVGPEVDRSYDSPPILPKLLPQQALWYFQVVFQNSVVGEQTECGGVAWHIVLCFRVQVLAVEQSWVQVFGGHSGWSCKALAPQFLNKCCFVSCSNPSAAIGGHAGLHVEFW